MKPSHPTVGSTVLLLCSPSRTDAAWWKQNSLSLPQNLLFHLNYLYWLPHPPNHLNPKPGNLLRQLLLHPHTPITTCKILHLPTLSVPDPSLLLYHCSQPQFKLSSSLPCTAPVVRVVPDLSFAMQRQTLSASHLIKTLSTPSNLLRMVFEVVCLTLQLYL